MGKRLEAKVGAEGVAGAATASLNQEHQG